MRESLLRLLEWAKKRLENKPDDTDYAKINNELMKTFKLTERLPDDLKKL